MHKLQYKILTLSIALVAISVLAINAPVMLWAQRDAGDRVTRSLQARASVYEAVMQSRSSQMLRTARLTAEGSQLGPALANGLEPAAIARLLDRARERAGAEMALVLDVDGQVLQHTGELQPQRITLPGLVARAAEQGMALSSLDANGLTYETVTVPLRSPLPTGWLTLAYAVDMNLATILKRLTGLDVILLRDARDGPVLLASTLENVALDRLTPALGAGAVAGEGGVPYSADDQDFRIISVPLVRGNTDVRVVLQESSTLALQNYSGLRWHLVSIAGIVLLLALLAGSWISRSISGPVSKLAIAAQRIAEGDYSEAVKFDGRGELHELAVAFNRMQEGIAEREERITYQAQFDELTGLPNRLCALERLGEAVTRAQRAAPSSACW